MFSTAALAMTLVATVCTACAQTPPSPTPIAPPAGCDLDPNMPIADALGRDVEDVPSLRFIDAVRTMSTTELERAGAVAEDPGLVARLGRVVKLRCTGPVAAVVSARALILASAEPGFALTSDEQQSLLGNLANAAGALASRDKLPSADVDAALAPFETTLAALALKPAPPPASCATPNAAAHTVQSFEPRYPASALGQSGLVHVAVRLNAAGLVPFARLDSSTVPAGSVLLAEALVAAVASTYAPATAACRPVDGSYLLSAQFAPAPAATATPGR